MKLEVLLSCVSDIVQGYREIERDNFNKGEYESVQDRYTHVLMRNHFWRISCELPNLHLGANFGASILMVKQLIESGGYERARKEGKELKAFGAQTKLTFNYS